MMKNNQTITYRPDVDGIRAIAILAVIFYHAFPEIIPGGFIGVDVFFVISGYLISSIIFRENCEGRFSLVNFYARRICRILPALLAVLASCSLAGWLLLLPDEFQALGKHVRGGAAYISNFVLKGEAGYFDLSAEYKPLLHLWSLAIEEQFYIVWPVLAAFLIRKRITLLPVIVLILAASFAYNIGRVATNPTAAFYLPTTRIWELLVGALVAHLHHFPISGRLAAALSAMSIPANIRASAGLACMVVPMAVLDKNGVFPGWWAAAPTVATALLISAGPAALLNRHILANPVMVFVGLVSFPLYLWHWPLLSLAHIFHNGEVAWTIRLALLGVAAALAILTYFALERPIRFGSTSRFRTAAILLALSVGVGSAGHAMLTQRLAPYSSRFGVDAFVAAYKDWDYPGRLEHLTVDGRRVLRKAGRGGTVLLLGDSNIQQYSPRVEALLEKAPHAYKTALFLADGGCPPIPVITRQTHQRCSGLMETAFATAEREQVDTVVMGAQWWGYFTNSACTVDGMSILEPEATRRALESLSATIRRFVASGRRVVVILNIPTHTALDPRSAIQRTFPTFTVQPGSVPINYLNDQYGKLSVSLRAAAEGAGATVIDPVDHLCRDGVCNSVTATGEPIYKDISHLRAGYVRDSVEYLDPLLRNSL